VNGASFSSVQLLRDPAKIRRVISHTPERSRAVEFIISGHRVDACAATMVLATHPKVMLLDEPLAGMSTHEAGRVIALIQSLKRTYSLILVEHDMDAVFKLADRISVLVRGRIIASDVPQQIKMNVEVHKAYLGSEEYAS
jgi:ABC-type branched-subunit amino acid transport system ATPase component